MNNLLTLSNGTSIPRICFGGGIVRTYRHANESVAYYMKYRIKTFLRNKRQHMLDTQFANNIKVAMDNGLSMFDTSKAYQDAEHELGRALKKYNREQYYIVTKVSNSEQYNGDMRKALEESLKQLEMEYVDLYLLHWPVTDVWIQNWKQLEKLYKEGLCKAIGVCNCNIHHLQELEQICEFMPMVNEFECHPLFTQNELRKYCVDHHIQVMAYTATARMDERLKKTVLVPISKKYNKSITQIMLKWHQQIGNIPIFNSSNPAHIITNSKIDDFQLEQFEIDQITAININSRLRYDPDNCDFRQL